MVDAVWLASLPITDAERLVAITQRNRDGQEIGVSYPNFRDLRSRTSSLKLLSAFNLAEINVIREGRPELANAYQVRGDFFDLLGFEAQMGRRLTPADDLPASEPVVVLSHHYWKSRFGGDPRRSGLDPDP